MTLRTVVVSVVVVLMAIVSMVIGIITAAICIVNNKDPSCDSIRMETRSWPGQEEANHLARTNVTSTRDDITKNGSPLWVYILSPYTNTSNKVNPRWRQITTKSRTIPTPFALCYTKPQI
ncbi:hypothetical protein Pcinc_007497 [Petrolisthes cinctipes]|uniref:Uncharacterized protein n=1 Tax=Petrolisthes cinctipes TaxID=88211 RepID=A0AAE1KWV3_PETCI|nr:hypothetical protein Pcinc_007497 [Petrolisthes cinctipes]